MKNYRATKEEIVILIKIHDFNAGTLFTIFNEIYTCLCSEINRYNQNMQELQFYELNSQQRLPVLDQKSTMKRKLSLLNFVLKVEHQWCRSPPFYTIVNHLHSFPILTTHATQPPYVSSAFLKDTSGETCEKV